MQKRIITPTPGNRLLVKRFRVQVSAGPPRKRTKEVLISEALALSPRGPPSSQDDPRGQPTKYLGAEANAVFNEVKAGTPLTKLMHRAEHVTARAASRYQHTTRAESLRTL
jgi:hypothetical protein